MNSSYFYHTLPYSEEEEPDWLNSLSEYSKVTNQRIYLLNHPVVDSEHVEYKNHFILLAPGFKLCIVQDTSKDDFSEYEEDIKGDIRYLFQKYDYRPIMGLYTKVEKDYVAIVTLGELANVSAVMEKLRLTVPQDKRKSELLVALCTGSINEIGKVGIDVPETLVEKVRHKIQLFDGDQTRFIYDASPNKVIKIQGLSGTGKTELLLHKLKELYMSSDDVKIFFTCHNKILASSLRNRIQSFFNFMKVSKQIDWDERLWCANAWGRSYDVNSGLYRYICHYYNLSFYGYSYSTSFDQLCRQALIELRTKPDFKPVFDYIIVDESQDFDENFEELCKLVCSKQVYMAGDVFQSIFAEHIVKAYNADFLLGKCYRTAPDTLMFAHALGLGLFEEKRYRWLNSKDWDTCGYSVKTKDNLMTLSREPNVRFDGDDLALDSVKVYQLEKGDNISKFVCEVIKKMNEENDGKLKPDDVAIIFVDEKNNNYNIANQITFAIGEEFNWETNKAYESKEAIKNTVLISNRNNVKGLEYPYVICITESILDSHQYRNALYTMLTRSFIRSYMVITDCSYKIPDQIIDGLNQIKKSHTMTIRMADAAEEREIGMRFEQAKRALTLKELIDKYISENYIDKSHADIIMNVLSMSDMTGLQEDDILDKIADTEKLLYGRKK